MLLLFQGDCFRNFRSSHLCRLARVSDEVASVNHMLPRNDLFSKANEGI